MRPRTAELLDLSPHPEGGWFRETWRTQAEFEPAGYPGKRSVATGIYFLLCPGEEPGGTWCVPTSYGCGTAAAR